MHHEPPDETTGALELDVGADDGDLSFAVRRLELLEDFGAVLREDDGVAVGPLGEEETAAGALELFAFAVLDLDEALA